jgi:hypothetical protein
MKALWDMKKLRVLFPLVVLAAFVVLSTAVALAGTPSGGGDPVIRTGGATHSVPITSRKFTIVSPTGNSPTDGSQCFLIQNGMSIPAPECDFLNETGDTINALLFRVDKADFSGNLSCALKTALGGQSPWFTQCAATPAGGPVVVFFGGPGIPPGGDFSLGFGMFDANAEFHVNALSTR